MAVSIKVFEKLNLKGRARGAFRSQVDIVAKSAEAVNEVADK
jgi:hypothetical protein